MNDRNCSGDLKPRTALLIRHECDSANSQRIAFMLDFFGIPWMAMTIHEIAHQDIHSLLADRCGYAILVSAQCLAEGLNSEDPENLSLLLPSTHSVLVYGFKQTDACRNLLRKITGDPEAAIVSRAAYSTTVSIANNHGICGPMSGLTIQLQPLAVETVLKVRPGADGFQGIIDSPEGHVLGSVLYAGSRYFIDASQDIIDLQLHSTSYFDVRKTFAGAIPIAMYLKWAFRDVCWQTPSTNACLIIDDPLLKPRYGFLSYKALERLLQQTQTAATIAFIPWNWRRTNRHTVAIFREHPDTLSICMHGSDHCGDEMASRSAERLDRELKTARGRMKRLGERTGLVHDNIQVFPQGAFSVEAMKALKENGFIAAVNTEASPLVRECNQTTIADLWSIAVHRYGGFPIFTRRYMEHGIENFAFDRLLGKPCFVVGHHDILRDQGSKLRNFLDNLPTLKWELNWTTLENAVSCSYSVQRRSGTSVVRMFATKLHLHNAGQTPKEFAVVKEEVDPANVLGINVNGNLLPYTCEEGRIRFTVTVPPQTAVDIHCTYRQKDYSLIHSDSLSYRLRVALRRYLSEFRDNYVSRNDLLNRSAAALVRVLKRPSGTASI